MWGGGRCGFGRGREAEEGGETASRRASGGSSASGDEFLFSLDIARSLPVMGDLYKVSLHATIVYQALML
jgi:hypothetical protein